jgi:hypothetical protein
MEQKFKIGDRVRLVGWDAAGYCVDNVKATVIRVHESGILDVNDDKDEGFTVTPLQCRRLKPRSKPREFEITAKGMNWSIATIEGHPIKNGETVRVREVKPI